MIGDIRSTQMGARGSLSILALAVALIGPGCGTATKGSSQQVRIVTTPPGAAVEIVDTDGRGVDLVAPAETTLSRGHSAYVLYATPEGHAPACSLVLGDMDNATVAVESIPVIPLIVDVATQSLREFPEEIVVTLTTEGKAPPAPAVVMERWMEDGSNLCTGEVYHPQTGLPISLSEYSALTRIWTPEDFAAWHADEETRAVKRAEKDAADRRSLARETCAATETQAKAVAAHQVVIGMSPCMVELVYGATYRRTSTTTGAGTNTEWEYRDGARAKNFATFENGRLTSVREEHLTTRPVTNRQVFVTAGNISTDHRVLGPVHFDTVGSVNLGRVLSDSLTKSRFERAVQGASPDLTQAGAFEHRKEVAFQIYGSRVGAVINPTYRTEPDGDVFADGLAVQLYE